ncbi:MAG: glutamyl-tRNA reductase, partial [Armatimonadota bacterium]
MTYLMVGLSHRTAPVEVRERFAFTAPGQLERALTTLREAHGLRDFLLISTCNRTELYVADPEASGDALIDALRDARGATADQFDREVFEERRCTAAVEHLFRVAAGLESMVLGETDIVRQVKDSYAAAVSAGATGPRIDGLVHEALRTAKRARTGLDLGRGVFSIGGAAADLAGSIFGDLAGRVILLLGAGKMGESTARHLASAG